MMNPTIQDRKEFESRLKGAVQKAESIIQDLKSGKIKGPGPWNGTYGLEQMVKWSGEVERHLANDTIPDLNTRNRKTPVRILVDSWDPLDPLGDEFVSLTYFWIRNIEDQP